MSNPVPVDFDALTTAEQIRYVQDLWDRIASRPEDVPVTDAQRAELRRRLEAHRADPEGSDDWEAVKARVRDRNR